MRDIKVVHPSKMNKILTSSFFSRQAYELQEKLEPIDSSELNIKLV